MRGPEAQALFLRYSGVWVLDSIESDRAPGQRAGDRDTRGGDPFGGARPAGARPPAGAMGGRGPGARGGGAGGPNLRELEARRATFEAAAARPTRITLELSDSTFEVVLSPGGRAVLPMGGDEVDLSRTTWPTRAKVRWDGDRPRYERRFDDGGKIVDHFELLASDRLQVVRAFDAGPGGDVELRFLYDRRGRD